MFQGSGAVFTTLGTHPPSLRPFLPLLNTKHTGFEYWANPDNPSEGYITWQSNGQKTFRLGAEALGPDQGPDGSGVGQRRIPEEPMVRFWWF